MSAPGKVILALLGADSGVVTLLGSGSAQRAYALRAPERVTMPFAIINKISDTRDLPITAIAGSMPCQARVQVSCYDSTAGGAKALADAVRSACDLKSGSISGVQVSSVLWDADSPDAYDFDVNLYHQPVDFIVHYYK